MIARINLLMTFGEYFTDRWGHAPRPEQYWSIADIIAWNLFQMDGLTGAVPYPIMEAEKQMVIDGWLISGVTMEEAPKLCRIRDWRSRHEVEYLSLKEKGDGAMKFDFIIGNPPYQEEAPGTSTSDKPIYHHFMNSVYEMADKVELITPARFLFNAGATSAAWNQKMLTDTHLKVLYYQANSDAVFKNTDIMGGIAVTYRDSQADFGAIEVFTAFPELNSILKKVSPSLSSNSSLEQIIYTQNKFDHDALNKYYPDLNRTDKRLESNAFKFSVFTENPESETDLKIIGLIGGKRVYRYVNKRFLDLTHDNLFKFKVILPKSNGSRNLGESHSAGQRPQPKKGDTLPANVL